jgi:hypothetical protein
LRMLVTPGSDSFLQREERRRHAPARQHKLPAIRPFPHNRSAIIAEMPGSGGRLPVWSIMARVRSMIPFCPLVML